MKIRINGYKINVSNYFIFASVICFFLGANNSYADLNFKNDSVLSVGAVKNSEQINLRLLDQTDSNSFDIQNSKILNSRADSINDTKRKSFHALRNVEEIHDSDVMVIK